MSVKKATQQQAASHLIWRKIKYWRQTIGPFCPGLKRGMHTPFLPPKHTKATQPTARAAKTNRPSEKHLNRDTHMARPLCFYLKQKPDTTFSRYTRQNHPELGKVVRYQLDSTQTGHLWPAFSAALSGVQTLGREMGVSGNCWKTDFWEWFHKAAQRLTCTNCDACHSRFNPALRYGLCWIEGSYCNSRPLEY